MTGLGGRGEGNWLEQNPPVAASSGFKVLGFCSLELRPLLSLVLLEGEVPRQRNICVTPAPSLFPWSLLRLGLSYRRACPLRGGETENSCHQPATPRACPEAAQVPTAPWRRALPHDVPGRWAGFRSVMNSGSHAGGGKDTVIWALLQHGSLICPQVNVLGSCPSGLKALPSLYSLLWRAQTPGSGSGSREMLCDS